MDWRVCWHRMVPSQNLSMTISSIWRKDFKKSSSACLCFPEQAVVSAVSLAAFLSALGPVSPTLCLIKSPRLWSSLFLTFCVPDLSLCKISDWRGAVPWDFSVSYKQKGSSCLDRNCNSEFSYLHILMHFW